MSLHMSWVQTAGCFLAVVQSLTLQNLGWSAERKACGLLSLPSLG